MEVGRRKCMEATEGKREECSTGQRGRKRNEEGEEDTFSISLHLYML